MTERHVAICIASFRRPGGLRKLLDAIARIDWAGPITVIVADNDPVDQEAIAVCEDIDDDFPWNLKTVVVEDAGLPFPRNASIALALEIEADLLAILDDDEWPEPEWLREFVSVLDLGADAVGGPVIPVFPDGTSDLLRSNSYFGHDRNLEAGAQCVLQAAGNFIVTADAMRPHGPPWFDPDLAGSDSGEDHDLLVRMDLAGATMRWAPGAGVWEDVPIRRLDDDWMRERVVAIHNTRVRIDQQHRPHVGSKLLRATKTFALGAQAALMSVVGLADPGAAYQAQLLRWKFRGKLTAHLGIRVTRREGRPNDEGS